VKDIEYLHGVAELPQEKGDVGAIDDRSIMGVNEA